MQDLNAPICSDGLYASVVELGNGRYSARIYRSGQILMEESDLASKDEVVETLEACLRWLGYDPTTVRIPYKKCQSDWRDLLAGWQEIAP